MLGYGFDWWSGEQLNWMYGLSAVARMEEPPCRMEKHIKPLERKGRGAQIHSGRETGYAGRNVV